MALLTGACADTAPPDVGSESDPGGSVAPSGTAATTGDGTTSTVPEAPTAAPDPFGWVGEGTAITMARANSSDGFVRAEIVLDSRQDVPVIPTDAVVNRGGKWVVFVVEAQRAQLREVELGLVSEETIEILGGLNVGEKVVVTGQDTLQDGAKVLLRG